MSFVVERPAVRVHVVDAATGSYLKRPGYKSAGLQFLERQEQQRMLDAPGHETMTTVYQPHEHGTMAAAPTILSHIPPVQTQASLLLVHDTVNHCLLLSNTSGILNSKPSAVYTSNMHTVWEDTWDNSVV